MTPLEHYRRAEELLSEAAEQKTFHLKAGQLTAMAAVHAQLAGIPQGQPFARPRPASPPTPATSGGGRGGQP